MYSKTVWRISSLVIIGSYWIASTFIEWKKLPTHAFDRDRVRQGVLEGLGWNIRRIWSTDWFKHPEAELKPIVEELKRLSAPIKQQASTESISEVKEKSAEQLSHKAAKTLEEALTRYKLVIEKKYPNTEPHEKLLRPDMIEHLIMDRPMTHEEFTLRVPAYLKQNTSAKEAADYLDDVLKIITNYESTKSFSLTSQELC